MSPNLHTARQKLLETRTHSDKVSKQLQPVVGTNNKLSVRSGTAHRALCRCTEWDAAKRDWSG